MGMNTSRNSKGAIADINVTPLVDVMLVLLVIFMITAPLMLNAIKLDLPKTQEVNPLNLSTKQVVLSYTMSKDYFIGKDRILKTELINAVKAAFKETKSETLFLRADFSMKYGDVASLMSFLKRGGVEKVALVTEVESK
jgi:biopolymer transport protein TolR